MNSAPSNEIPWDKELNGKDTCSLSKALDFPSMDVKLKTALACHIGVCVHEFPMPLSKSPECLQYALGIGQPQFSMELITLLLVLHFFV